MSFNLTTFLFEVVNFVVLAAVLYRLLYKPLREAIAKRQEENARAREEAEKARQEAQALRQRLDIEAADMERQREESLRQAREQAEAERMKVLREAEQAGQRRQEEVRKALQLERAEALQSLRQEVVGMAVGLSERLLRQAADSSLHRQLILRLVEALDEVAGSERDRLRRNWHPEDEAVLETANGVDDATLVHLNGAVASMLGRPASVALRHSPDLLSGVRLRLGGMLWDSSLSGQLEGVRRDQPVAEAHEEGVECQTLPCN